MPTYFNPRYPYRYRPKTSGKVGVYSENFNPRYPYRYRPHNLCSCSQRIIISIHDTHTGIDQPLQVTGFLHHYFNPRYPYRYRRETANLRAYLINISIHDTHTGIDSKIAYKYSINFPLYVQFIHSFTYNDS